MTIQRHAGHRMLVIFSMTCQHIRAEIVNFVSNSLCTEQGKKKKTAHGTHLFFFFFSREVLLFETEQNNNFSDPPSNFCDTQAGNCCIRWQCSQYHTCSPFLIQLQKERQERFHTMDWLDHFCQDQTTFLWATHLLLRTHTILPSFHFQN